MTEIFSQPDDAGPARASEAETSLSGRLGAQAAESLDPKNSLSGMYIGRRIREGIAGGYAVHDWDGAGTPEQQMALQGIDESARAAIPDISQGDAKLLLKQEGLTEQDVHLGDQETHKLPVLKMQIDEAHTRRDRQAAIERGPQGFFPGALGLVTSLGVGMIDPVNAAAFSIPVIGEARMGKILASAGDSILARGAARFGQGAAQGTVGTAALQPADWWLHTRDGQDYTMAQGLESVIMGAGMGGAFHAGFGGFGHIRNRARGLPLEGSPQDLLLRGLMTGTHVHADALADEGVPLEEVPGIAPVVPGAEPFPGDQPIHPAEVLADLPPAAREDAVHAAMADVISGSPTQAAEMLNIAADHDPRIAQSFEAYHGSPHDFDQFDVSKIGEGEGAQSYGHGLYFAENEDVAREYNRRLSNEAGGVSAQALADPELGPRLRQAKEEYERLNGQFVDALNAHDEAKSGEVEHQIGGQLRYLEAIERDAREKYPTGALYKVRINADQEHFIDWDKRLDEQSPRVQEAIKHAMGIDYHGNFDAEKSQRMWDEHRYSDAGVAIRQGHIAFSDEQVAKRLSDAGIPGIKYLDQGSRRGPGGMTSAGMKLAVPPKTHNFVVFNDKHIEITHKNGEPVKREDLVAEHRAQQAAKKSLRGRAAADPATWSLFEHLASEGGLKPDPELRAIFGNDRGPFVPGFGPLLRKTGMSLDDALTRAKEGGYFIDPTDPAHAPAGVVGPEMQGREATFGIRDLLDKVDEENRGRKQYRANHLEATKYDPAQESHLVLTELEHELGKSGARVEDIDPELLDRTVEIVKRDGETDVLAAYERTIMEDAERYDATAHERQSTLETAHIPGWDAADRAAAHGDGRTGPEGGGQEGRPEQGARGDNGAQPSRPGRGNRSSHAVVAADPRWRELANSSPDYDDPEVLAESEEAARTPEPASVDPAKSLSALEKAAADAEEVWRQLEPTLTEDERKAVNDAFANMQVDKATRDRMIADGVSCLMGAIG